jgi:hypothetical protein
MSLTFDTLEGNEIERYGALRAVRQAADVKVRVGTYVAAMELQYVFGRISRLHLERPLSRPPPNAFNGCARGKTPLGRGRVESHNDMDAMAMAEVEPQRRRNAVLLGRQRKQLLDNGVAIERCGDIFEECQQLVVASVARFDELANRFSRLGVGDLDVLNAVALEKDFDRAHEQTLWCSSCELELL